MAAALSRLREALVTRDRAAGWPRGAIGASSATGLARYGYPEIAGYWLHWACQRDDVCDDAGAAVIEWLGEVYHAHGCWPPRVSWGTLAAAYQHASYLFDHAMLWHGLHQWGCRRNSAAARSLASQVWQQMQQFVDGDALIAAHGAHSGRWSGGIGPYLLKACSRLRHGSGALAAVSAKALGVLKQAALARPHAEAHPQLYAIEGLIEIGAYPEATRALTELIQAHGGIPNLRESRGSGPRRSDVLAQLLRAALLLSPDARADPQWSALARELAARIDSCGRLPFAAAGEDCPTWAQLFAEQALALWQGETLPVGVVV